MLGSRNRHGLTNGQIEHRLQEWEYLCGGRNVEIDTSHAAEDASLTRYNEKRKIVILGANVVPGEGVGANARMSTLACLAHELAHFERHALGYSRTTALPDVLLDEAEASIRASFTPGLSERDRLDLVEDARDRLDQWLSTQIE